jgi:hypothetical protein
MSFDTYVGGHPQGKCRKLKHHTTFCVKQQPPGNTCVTPNFMAKTECIPFCVLGSSFTHKATTSEINSITSIYYIESYYKTYYKTKRSTQRNKAPHHR